MTQIQCCYKFSGCASKAAFPTIGDVKALNKLARQLKSQPVKLQFWPLTGPWKIIGSHDATYKYNEDGSSQRGMAVFLAESRVRSTRDGMSYGSLIDYESQKIKKTVLSTTVAELCSFMWSVLGHARSSVDCGWTCQVKLQKFTWGLTRRTWWQQQEQFTHLNKLKPSTRFSCCERKLV